MSLVVLTQNSYAIQFSTFGSVLLSLVFVGKRVFPAMLATLLLWSAVLINGSRGGWLAVLASTLVFVWIFMRTQRQRGRALAVSSLLIAALGLGALLAPENILSAFEQRVSTFQTLDEDKSYAIRVLMNQKGIRLFQASPFIGVGGSRWQKETIPLDLPHVLQYASQAHFDRKSPHNSYIGFLAENGLAGTIPFSILLIMLVFRGYRATFRLARRGEIWAIGTYAGFIGMSIHLSGLSGLTSSVTWFMYGLVAAIIELDRQATIGENRQGSLHATRVLLPRSSNP
jgi:O-antigen ligase